MLLNAQLFVLLDSCVGSKLSRSYCHCSNGPKLIRHNALGSGIVLKRSSRRAIVFFGSSSNREESRENNIISKVEGIHEEYSNSCVCQS